jgi:hypothetical protein
LLRGLGRTGGIYLVRIRGGCRHRLSSEVPKAPLIGARCPRHLRKAEKRNSGDSKTRAVRNQTRQGKRVREDVKGRYGAG